MTWLHKPLRTINQLRTSEDGSIAIAWAVSLFAVLVTVGAGYDYAQVTSAKDRAQSIADSVALSAAIYVKNNGGPPSNPHDGYKHNHNYSASDVGYSFSDVVVGGSDGVSINVQYDDSEKVATVLVGGKTKTAFASLFGNQFNNLDFKVKATVNYFEVDLKDPASIILVLDNSGSMSWDDKPLEYRYGSYHAPDNAQPRITGLKTTLKNFMDDLENIVGPQTTIGSRVLRMGMLPYNTSTISYKTVYMNWGTISDSSINYMSASGGTNSAPSMTSAQTWMTGENLIHQLEHGNSSPLQFVIFMTDGVNTSGGETCNWVASSTSDYWRKSTYGGYRYYNNSYGYYSNSQMQSYGYTEGENVCTNNADTTTSAKCEALKSSGAKVYTIGYGLEPGYYDENDDDYYGNPRYEYISEETRDHAYTFLRGCASDETTFAAAANADTLEQVFEQIGEDIVEEIIRISS